MKRKGPPQKPTGTTHDLGFAMLDIQRSARQGFPEVIYCEGKSPAQAAKILRALREKEPLVLATRVSPEHARAMRKICPGPLLHDAEARCVVAGTLPPPHLGVVGLFSAGTSDAQVAAEAALTARCFGAEVRCANDVGVAGLHRLLTRKPILEEADVFIVVAGMEGALPSVVAGLVDRPVIAVPTSVGYGAAFGGVAALLGMLTSCGSGVTVVNIDNGFGAGFAAGQILRLCAKKQQSNSPQVRTLKNSGI
jgi:NCAIR mutase (PurE)-related protein